MIVPLILLALQLQGGTQQLVARSGQAVATLNGSRVTWKSSPIVFGGRTMVPLRETINLFGLKLYDSGSALRVGNLSFSESLDTVSLNGVGMPGTNLYQPNQDLYISAKLLADGIGAKFRVGNAGEFYLTVMRDTVDNPLLPQPRFTTNKEIYAVGEPVEIEEFSFDPLGENVYLHWTNLSPAYFRPGAVTITLEATNAAGKGNRLSKTILVADRVANTPLQFDLKYGQIGDSIHDDTLRLPTLPGLNFSPLGNPLLFSDSPEEVDRMGTLFRDQFQGDVRLVAYHLNASSNPAHLCVAVKNVDSLPTKVRSIRLGDTAPAQIEGVLGQVTLLSFLTDHSESVLNLDPGESALIYVSPPLTPHSGASVMADLHSDRKVQIEVAMTIGDLPATADTVLGMGLLARDRNHVRGNFPSARRSFSLDLLNNLPGKAVIGEGAQDLFENGVSPDSKSKETLEGNYGVSYEITLHNANGVVGAIAPRGGLYKGVVVVEAVDTGKKSLVRLPRSGVLVEPNQPMIFLRSSSRTVRLEFIPASGSQLPVHLAFYRP